MRDGVHDFSAMIGCVSKTDYFYHCVGPTPDSVGTQSIVSVLGLRLRFRYKVF